MPNESKKSYRVGVIGHTGRGNYGHGMDTAWLSNPRTEIVAVADAHESGLQAALKKLKVDTGYADYREMIEKEKLDIVAVCPRWIDQHHKMIMSALEHGCHVYTEKPFTRTLAEADDSDQLVVLSRGRPVSLLGSDERSSGVLVNVILYFR